MFYKKDYKYLVLLFSYKNPASSFLGRLTKMSNNDNFDIGMGYFHGTEVCNIICLYTLNEISPIICQSNLGLYRDYVLGKVKLSSG